MKKNIKKAQSGKTIRGTSTTYPEGIADGIKSMMNPPKTAAQELKERIENPENPKPRVGPIRRGNNSGASSSSSSSSAPAKTEEKKGGGGSGGAKGTKGAGTSAGSSARKVTRTAAAKISAPKREMPSLIQKRESPIKTSGIQKGPEKREFTKTESKIAGELQKMKSGENTEASRAKIKALQDKRRAEKMKAERQKDRSNNKALRKSARAAKFNARQVKKSAK
jgi:Spy/CpxP family protein refolding chaperone